MSDALLETLCKSTVLMNDFYSYDREIYLHRTAGNRMFNAVHFLMEHEALHVQDSKAKVRGIIQKYERQFLQEKHNFFAEHPDISYNLKQHIEHCTASMGGSHYWTSIADRHRYWKDLPGAQLNGESLSNGNHHHINGTKDNTSKIPKHEPVPSVANGEQAKVDKDLIRHNKYKPDTPDLVENGSNMMKKPSQKIKPKQKILNRLNDSLIQGPYSYIRSLPSKGVRRLMIESLNEWLDVPKPSQDTIISIVDLLHNSSLMLDDCEDGSDLRRGKPASHMVYGQAQTINTATFMFVCAVQEAANLTNRDSVPTLSQHLKSLFVGQSWDLYWREKFICPTEDDYLEMIDKKTGGLFQLLTNLMQLESNNPQHYDLDPLVSSLGRYFQIRDDLVNLTSQKYCEQKGFCEDLDEGKISYCLVMCAAADKGRADQVLGLFRQHAFSSQRTMQRQTKEHILKLFEESGALEAAKAKSKELEAVVDQEIARLEDVAGVENPMLKVLVEMLRV